MDELKAPFPWFGGKSRVADVVWQALGDVELYVEPFFGSGAVLLGRPAEHKIRRELVNDIDGYVVNFWRAVKRAPDEVAYWADDNPNEIDLTARHIWLVNSGRERLERLYGDPEYYDSRVAGWWVWGISLWIGSDWCSGRGAWTSVDGRLVQIRSSGGNDSGDDDDHQAGSVYRKLPSLGIQKGIHRGSLRGAPRQRPHITNLQGVFRANQNLYEYMAALADRLRNVIVCCGDWGRVCTTGALSGSDITGIFLDPPYDTDHRESGLYTSDNDGRLAHISREVREWCIANGDNPRYRIVLAGYEGEHEMPESWREYAWTANRSYGNSRGDTKNNENRRRERLWFSPHCIELQPRLL